MTQPVVGSVPRGQDYFGQEKLVETIWLRLEKDNVLLAAPRRFGKTGAMYRILDEPSKDFVPVYTDLEPIESAGDFMVEILSVVYRKRRFKNLPNKLWEGSKDVADFFRNMPQDVEIGGLKVGIREKTDVAANWRSYGERPMNLLASQSPSLLLILDEFAVMIDTIFKRDKDEDEALLRWFRRARQMPETKTRFLLGSSIHLIPTLDQFGLADSVNDLCQVRIAPFDRVTAEKYIRAVFQNWGWPADEEIVGAILNEVGAPIPFFLAVMLTELQNRRRISGVPPTKETVESVFQEELLGGSIAATLRQYKSRIANYYRDSEGRAAHAILKALSRSESGLSGQSLYQLFLKHSGKSPGHDSEEDFTALMFKLDNDFYISRQDEKYDFFSRVLKLWWKSHYGFQGGI